MATTGKILPGTCANVAFGGIAWSNVDNAKLVDGNNATITFTEESSSDLLVASNFGFAIPAGSTINGVIVYLLGSDDFIFDADPLQQQVSCFLYNGGVLGAEKDPVLSGIESSAGSSSDKWGATLTAAIVNGSGFGVAMGISVGGYDSFGDARIDYVKLEVFYTLATGGKQLMMMGIGS